MHQNNTQTKTQNIMPALLSAENISGEEKQEVWGLCTNYFKNYYPWETSQNVRSRNKSSLQTGCNRFSLWFWQYLTMPSEINMNFEGWNPQDPVEMSAPGEKKHLRNTANGVFPVFFSLDVTHEQYPTESDKTKINQEKKQTCEGGVCLAEDVVKARQNGSDSSLRGPEQGVSHIPHSRTEEEV